MFKNALVYRIEPPLAVAVDELETRLSGSRFMACGASQMESNGWVEPRGEQHGAMVESVAGHLMLRLCSERKAVPSSVVKSELALRLDKIEADTGRRPKGKAARELKDDIVHSLLPRAFPKQSTIWVWIDLQAQQVVIGAASLKKADAIVSLLVDLLGGASRLTLLQTQESPATAMAHWLTTQEAPAGFSVDRDCELKQPDREKSAVRYARHTLDIEEVGLHIAQGKIPTQLAMTWQSRVSFVLTESMAIRKIKLLDVVLEGAGMDASAAAKADASNGFDADVAITTGELRQMINDLIDALGGQPTEDLPAATAAAAESALA